MCMIELSKEEQAAEPGSRTDEEKAMANIMFTQVEITDVDGIRKDYVVRVDEYFPLEQMILDLLGSDTKSLPEVWNRISESMGATEMEHLEDSDGMVISVDNTFSSGPYVTAVFYDSGEFVMAPFTSMGRVIEAIDDGELKDLVNTYLEILPE